VSFIKIGRRYRNRCCVEKGAIHKTEAAKKWEAIMNIKI
jgi:hypothetical protein